jgi:hypothetical protein
MVGLLDVTTNGVEEPTRPIHSDTFTPMNVAPSTNVTPIHLSSPRWSPLRIDWRAITMVSPLVISTMVFTVPRGMSWIPVGQVADAARMKM